MRLVLVSDTHGRHEKSELPAGDVLVHAGDFTMGGTRVEIEHVARWLKKIRPSFKEVVTTAGNHDWLFERNNATAKKIFEEAGVRYLENEMVELAGVRFWGSPMTPWFLDWAFNVDRAEIHKYWDEIPAGVDVLITHGPPLGVLDQAAPHLHSAHLGDKALLDAVVRVKPKVHVFGHIHGGYEQAEFKKEDGVGTKFFNASFVDEAYQPVNKPWVVDI